jgi:hypothetical protein
MNYPLLAAAVVLTAVSLRAGDGKIDPVKPVNLEKLNTEADEDDPFTPDSLNLFYASNKAGRWEIMVSRRSAASVAWPAGKTFLVNKEADFRSPFARGSTLYFASNKVPDDKLKDLKNFDIMQKVGDRAPLPLVGISEKED